MKLLQRLIILLAVALFASVAQQAHAQTPTVDGTRDAAYGSALAVQTVNTSFGNNTSAGGLSTGGSDLDAAYGVVSGANLYLFVAGNFQDNGNRLNLFIADGRTGQSTFSYPSGSIANINGSKFSSGFQCTFAMDLNLGSGGSVNASEFLVANGTTSGGSQGAFTITSGIGSGTPNNLGWATPITIALNDLNTAGVTGSSTGTAADPIAAAAVTTGYELAIPLSLLGNPTGSIEVLVDQNAVSDNGPLSNQFLPGLPVGTTTFALGGPYTGSTTAKFDFSSTPNEYFTVVVPEPSTEALTLLGLTGLVGLLIARRRAVIQILQPRETRGAGSS